MSALEALEDKMLAHEIVEAENEVPLAGKLDWSPKKNWVEEEGGLPKPIEDMAVEIIKSGKTREHAIAIAVSRSKVLAAKGDQKYVKAVAKWEKMKAARHAKKAAK
jgi:hypothetical protein